MDAFWRFTRQMIRTHRIGIVVAMIFAFISAGGMGAGLVSLGPMFRIILNEGQSLADLARQFNEDAQRWFTIPQNVIDQLPTQPYRSVLMIIVGLAILTVFGAVANFLHQYLSQTITTKAIATVREQSFATVLHMPLSRVVQRGPSEFVARIIRDSAELQRGLIALLSKSVTQITKGLAAFIAALIFDWKLTIIAIVVLPILMIILRKLGKRIRRGTRGSLQAQEQLLRVATETFQGLRMVKANTAEEKSQKRFDEINRDVVHHELRIRAARALSSPMVETLAVFAIGILALIAVKNIIDHALPLDRFILTLGCLGVSGGSFRPLAGLVTEIQAAAAPAGRLEDILSEPAEATQDDSLPELPPHQQAVEFRNVTFTYPNGDTNTPAVRDITFTVLHGERIAIVGPNGSGKTTLLSFLPRLLLPNAGQVLVDGTDIMQVNLTSLRQQIGVVTQDTVLIRGSIAENIAFGMAETTRSQVEEAARQAHAYEFIETLPGGFDADLAEQGASLSGGQRQRLAIARAILRDPTILILDEATSQIDAESETHINAAIKEFCVGRTAFLIAHRLATVLSADRILVMDQGRIVDDGSHEELLKRCDLYQRLVEGQLVTAG